MYKCTALKLGMVKKLNCNGVRLLVYRVCVCLTDAASFDDEVLTAAALLKLMERLLALQNFRAVFLICRTYGGMEQ